MQLIELIESSAIDIKNNMSTLEETIENNQINGVVDDIRNDNGKVSNSKNNTASNTVQNTNGDSTIKEILENKLKDLNGIARSNGDAQKLSVDNYKNEREINIIHNESAANGQSNESSLLSESCESSNSNLDHIDTTAEGNTNLENSSINLNKTVESSEKKEVTMEEDMESSDVLLNEKEIPDMISVQNLATVVDVQATVSNDEVPVANELKSIEISIENESLSLNVSDFSPNSDTNEKVNISAQLQQLENDASIEDGDIKILTNKSNTLETDNQVEVPTLTNDKLVTPVQNLENDFFSKPTEENDTIGDSEVRIEIPLVGDEHIDKNIVSETDLKVSPSIDKPDKTFVISLEVTPLTPLIGKDTETKSSVDVVKENINKTITEISETKDVPKVAIIKQSIVGTSDINMDVDNCEPVHGQKEECSKSEDVAVEKEPPVHKYVTVKNIMDMVYPAALNTTTETVETTDAPVGELAQIDENQQNEVMDVCATPENSITFDTSDKHQLVQETEVENNVEMANTIKDDTMDESSEVSKENLVVAIEQQKNDNSSMKIDNSAVMEINDCDEVPVVEQSASDNVVKVDTENTSGDVKICEEKQNTVIDIIDNDDEDITLKDSDSSNVISIDESVKDTVSEELQKHSTVVEIVNEVKEKAVDEKSTHNNENLSENTSEEPPKKQLPVVCKLSNTMDILSDDEDDLAVAKSNEKNKTCENRTKVEEQNKCINIDDDDDIMFIEDTNSQDVVSNVENKPEQQTDKIKTQTSKTTDSEINADSAENEVNSTKIHENESPKACEDSTAPPGVDSQPEVLEPMSVEETETQKVKPIITKSFLKSVTKNLADMTRNELEDFCILKLVESVVDKSNLNEIKNKMKTMAQTVEDLRKKALALTKQNRDLQVVVKTVQEDHKKKSHNPMMPMKITRSVGMQVVLSSGEKSILKKKLSTPSHPPPVVLSRPVKNNQSPKAQKAVANNINIPVPRLVPASSPTVKSPATPVISTKPTNTPPKNTTQQRPEKRPHNKLSSSSPASSVTVDLTDDEPPAKINTKNPTPPVRLVPSQSLMAPKNRPQFSQTGNSPRKVYIPISSSNPNVRPPQPNLSVMKNFTSTPKPRPSSVVRMQTLRVNQLPTAIRHPAPLPDAMKQYQPPTWKALPPAPDLKLSKVDNGIVISWKFEGCQPDAYEEVASFQLYAYQETPVPPSTALWKKIGDIKALPLPMACTLTQFMSGFKYYFAVRAIDVRSRIGPFSLPGSIMLISKS